MREALLLGLLCLGFSAYQVEGKTCKKNFGGCDKAHGLCWDTPLNKKPSSFCTCKSGYNFKVPATRSGKCVDINECKTGLHNCDTVRGKCVNTIGSHRCVCNRGYVLDYTKTTCLIKSKIQRSCRRSLRCRRRRRSHRSYDRDDRVKFFMNLLSDKDEDKAIRCSCETGYELRGGCKYCQDINECKRKKSMCDLRRGYCHNTDGGYYCTCKVGYVLGPCGFKCYRALKRPKQCNSKTFMKHSLVRGDSDGLNDEASRAVVLDYMTEKAAVTGKSIVPLQTLAYTPCTGKKTKTISYDINRDGKTDVRVKYTCLNKIYYVQGVYDSEAFWTQWTCWTSCRPTCHGGIQTRTRICKNGLVGEGKCQGPATKYKTCYTGRRCKMRVRREANSLTKKQQKDLIHAMNKYKKDTSTYGFHSAAGTHVFPWQCRGTNGKPSGCCYHGARLNFATWHRSELLNFEEGLTRHLKDKTLGLPYWDWLKHPTPPAFVWNKKLYGKKNPFASAVVRYDTSPPTETVRTKFIHAPSVAGAQSSYLGIARKLMRAHTIHEFSEALENAHNAIHGAVCITWPNCTVSMSNLDYAAFDPIFFFHHSNVDRLFANFQQYMISQKETAWTRQSVLEPQENIYHFNEYMDPYRNKTLTPFKRLHRLSTIENAFYYKSMLGYRYDTIKVPKKAGKAAKVGDEGDEEKGHTAAGTDSLNIAQFEKSIKTNVKVTFYYTDAVTGIAKLKACSKLSQSDPRYIGNVTILGTATERPWKSRQATIVPFSRPFTSSGWQLSSANLTQRSNFHLKACYTHELGCTKNCKQVSSKVKKLIPSPQLLFFPKKIRQDIFKFQWDSSEKYPNWVLDIKSGTQWVQFWGKEAANIVQVSNRANFKACKSSGGKKVPCTTSPCILQSGVHYFIHKNAAKCRKGMRLRLLAKL